MKFLNKKIIFFAAFLLLIIIVQRLHIYDCCTISYIHQNLRILQKMVHEHYYTSMIVYMILYIIASACAIPGSSFFLIAAGAFFGLFSGFLYANIAATVGATTLFLLSRYFFASFVERKYPIQLVRFNKEVIAQGYAYLLVVRLVAIFPFFLVNLLAGLTALPVRTFIWTTSAGMMPMAFVYILVGHQLAASNSLDMVFSIPLAGTFALFGMLRVIVVPSIYYLVRNRKKIIKHLNA